MEQTLSVLKLQKVVCVFDKHVANIVHTASSRAYLILKSFVTRDQHILVKAFTTDVRPLLEYCTPVWSPHLNKFIHMVENVQRRFTKRIGGISHLTYPARLQFLGLEALQERRLKFDLIMCHKVMYNFVEVDTSDFFAYILMIEHVVIMSDWSNLPVT